jgi:SAM-dependent methyltransferase
MQDIKEVFSCLACGSTELTIANNLGNQPLANNFLPSENSEENSYPLQVNLCKKCYHLQLSHVVDPKIIYTNYAYVSGTSQTYLDYMWWFAKWCREYSNNYRGSVLDIGCNDGSQLDFFNKLGFSTYGVDPAENLHTTSTGKGHRVVCGFWNEESIGNLDNRQFDIVVAQNAFAHNPDPLTYLQLLKPLLKDKGLFFIQTSQADMVRNGEFDTIYHEHVNFYNINSMNELCKRAGLGLVDVIKTPIHGTSYVFVVGNNGKPEHIKNLIELEKDLLTQDTYIQWQHKTKSLSKSFLDECERYREQGYLLVGYGAAAKGNTMLNYAGLVLDYIVDDNPLKQGTYSPGLKIPVVSSDIISSFDRNDKILFVPLAWNIFKEIKSKIISRRANANDRFIRYFPEVKIET